MKIAHRRAAAALLPIAATVALVPGAHAARDTPQGTVAAYLAALRSGDAQAMCATFDPTLRRELGDYLCGPRGRIARQPVRATVKRVLHRGPLARVELTTRLRQDGVVTLPRDRLVLRNGDGWGLVGTGSLSSLGDDRGPGAALASALDPRPARAAPAVRRLVDDELLALSGGSVALCDVLAPGAPLRKAACTRHMLPSDRFNHEGAPERLPWNVLDPKAVGSTWPVPTLPAVSAVPGDPSCREPEGFEAEAISCPGAFSPALAATGPGTALAGWLQVDRSALVSHLRPVSGGAVAGNDVRLAGLAAGEGDWPLSGMLAGLATVDGGALALLFGAGLDTIDVAPVDPSGAPRGPARHVAAADRLGFPQMVPAPDGGAEVVFWPDGDSRTVYRVHLAPDGTPSPAAVLSRATSSRSGVGAAVALGGGALALVQGGKDVTLRVFDAAGVRNAELRAPTAAGEEAFAPAVAAAGDGTLLVAWRAVDAARRTRLRVWHVDPSTPQVGAVRDLGSLGAAAPAATERSPSSPRRTAGASPSVVTTRRSLRGALDLRALDSAGGPVGPPVRVADDVALTLGDASLAITAGTVTWRAGTLPFGPIQVRAAGLG